MPLWLIATPIGNLGDVTFRAVEAFKAADVVCAEDTRRTRILFQRYGIRQRPVSYRDQNAVRLAPQIADWVAAGKTVALVTDAGTPGVSDPGYRAVKAVLDRGLKVEMLPGASSVLPALVLSGLGVDRFAFEGFLPVRKGRRARLRELAVEPRTMVMFESPHRLAKTLGDLAAEFGGERRAAVARELTKVHEEVRRGTLDELTRHYTERQAKGEITVVVEGATAYTKRRKAGSADI